MKRSIITIDEDKCNGCGACVDACHEGALQMIDGKARLVSESYCDGLGACLPECPTGAISIEERESAAFDEAAVKARMEKDAAQAGHGHGHPRHHEHEGHHGHHDHHGRKSDAKALEDLPCGCPGSHAKTLDRAAAQPRFAAQAPRAAASAAPVEEAPVSRLQQWPVQIKLVPVTAPYLDKAHLLVAADCVAYARAGIHEEFIKGRITLIGCPKLDVGDYSEKLAQILSAHEIKSITVLRMEVPCCGGIVQAVKQAMVKSGTMVPWSVVTVGTDGSILE
jgi:NAD-dependent dihydropyrimidine dehydrogenase PreA subunit